MSDKFVTFEGKRYDMEGKDKEMLELYDELVVTEKALNSFSVEAQKIANSISELRGQHKYISAKIMEKLNVKPDNV